jgi:hypothetical protein
MAKFRAIGPFSQEDIEKAYGQAVNAVLHERGLFIQSILSEATAEELGAIFGAEVRITAHDIIRELKTVKWEQEIRAAIDACDACDDSGALLDTKTGKPVGGPCDRHPYHGMPVPDSG